MSGWKSPAVADAEPVLDPSTAILRDGLTDAIWTAAHSEQRTLQTTIGPSEVGQECNRRLLYRCLGTPRVNYPDPVRSMAGTGMHEVLASYFRRLDGGSGRYLVEQRVEYRGVGGSIDLYDRRRRTLVDWKSPLKAKARKVPTDGPSHGYVVQVHIYGAALREAGENVENVALCYLPPDGTLADMRVVVQPLDVSIADKALDRLTDIASMGVRRVKPAEVNAKPSRLCGWCPYWRENSTNLDVACPGEGGR